MRPKGRAANATPSDRAASAVGREQLPGQSPTRAWEAVSPTQSAYDADLDQAHHRKYAHDASRELHAVSKDDACV